MARTGRPNREGARPKGIVYRDPSTGETYTPDNTRVEPSNRSSASQMLQAQAQAIAQRGAPVRSDVRATVHYNAEGTPYYRRREHVGDIR